MPVRAVGRTWRTFKRSERAVIERQLAQGHEARCPRCGALLAAQPSTRFLAVSPRGAKGLDLDCRRCRRFHPRLCYSPECLYILRIQRLAASVLRA